MESSNDLECFLNLTLSLIHPDLFRTGLGMLLKLRMLETTKAIAQEWKSVHTGVSVISNRITPSHRDSRSRAEWYNTLVNYADGGDSSKPQMLIKDIGLDLDYSSGAVISFCGSVFEHEVQFWGQGDRVCQAHFMQESVRKRLGVSAAGWVNQDTYYQHIPQM
jgi:hypothetical protein